MEGNTERDRVFDCLAHPHRRAIVEIVRTAGSSKSTFELAQDVAEEVREPSRKGGAAFESVRQSLYHVHLPKLEESALVEYDEERDVVAPTELTPRLGVLLDVMDLIAGEGRHADVATRDWDDEQIVG